MIMVCKFPCCIIRRMLPYKHIEGYRYRLSDRIKDIKVIQGEYNETIYYGNISGNYQYI